MKMQAVFAFIIISLIYINYKLVAFVIPLFLVISYFRLFKYKNLTDVLILILMSRCIMGLLIPHSDGSFNALNIICNYLPFFIFILINPLNFSNINKTNIWNFKWTIIYTICVIILCFYDLNLAITEFRLEVLPLLLVTFLICFSSTKINTDHLIFFLRVVFIASLLTYFLPNYYETCDMLIKKAVVFKRPDILPLKVNNIFVKQLGFIFDWRTMGQIAFMYLMLILVNRKGKARLLDHFLVIVITLSTFSRGPIVVMVLIYIGFFITRLDRKLFLRLIPALSIVFLFFSILTVSLVQLKSKEINEYLHSFFSSSKKNALSQRQGFTDYAIDESKNHRLTGLGIGALSSKNADNKIYFGYTSKSRAEKIFYYQVSDAYWALSLGEKGIIVLVFFILSTIEIFYRYNNMIFLFFMIGFYLNLIGTDIPKESMYYFTIVIIALNLRYPFIKGSTNENLISSN